jgi:hypothetical protein
MNPAALYDALNCASLAVLAAEGGRSREAEEAYMEASVAAMDAFPDGSAEAAALNVVLGAVGEAARGVTALWALTARGSRPEAVARICPG